MSEHADYLRYLTYRGVDERYGFDITTESNYANTPADEIAQRIFHELEVIEHAGFPEYFLIVSDMLRFCREHDIPTGPGRGSVCGSAVAYAIRITDVDPIRFDIPFERFLHLERISQPDIDLDICQARRGEVIQYLHDRYGSENVAQIVTFGTLMAKGVVRDVCRVLHVDDKLRGVPSNETGEKLAALIPEGSGADQVKLEEFMASEEGAEFKAKIEKLKVPYARRTIDVLDTALRLEGLRRHSSVHAAGVVIADRPLIEVAPLYRRNQDAGVQIQYDMKDAETVGLLKMDILGLRTMTVIGDAEKLIRQHTPNFSIKDVPLDDKRTFAMLSAGDTVAVFQLEGQGITGACTGMKPDRFEDIIALIALYRPGPMEQLPNYIHRKHGEEAVTYPHPDLQPVLERTYGLIVYQEQVIGMARTLAGYTAGEGDMFRKAIGKKLPELIRSEIDKFTERAVARGYDVDLIREIGQQIAYFGRYGFNLGHATGYGFITYWTAYLKANYPREFFTATLNSYVGDIDKLAGLINDAKHHGINFLPPDINTSGTGFTIAGDDSIRFGLGSIKGLGESTIRDILEERDSTEKNDYSTKRVERTKADGTQYKTSIRDVQRVGNVPRPYRDTYEFCSRLPHINVGIKKTLAMAGVFGGDIGYRKQLYRAMDRLNKAAKAGKPFNEPDVWDEPLMSDIEAIRAERVALGCYVTTDPMGYFRDDIRRFGAHTAGNYGDLPVRSTVAGIVTKIRTHHAKNGEMAWVTIDNEIDGFPDITLFAEAWAGVKERLTPESVIAVYGQRTSHPKFGNGFTAMTVSVLSKERLDASLIRVSIPDADITDLVMMRDYLDDTGLPLQIAVQDGVRWPVIMTDMKIDTTNGLLTALEELGWRVDINPETASNVTHAGSGNERKATWELPLAQAAVRMFGGRVVGEIKR